MASLFWDTRNRGAVFTTLPDVTSSHSSGLPATRMKFITGDPAPAAAMNTLLTTAVGALAAAEVSVQHFVLEVEFAEVT